MTDKSSYQPGEPIWADLGTPDFEASLAFYGPLFGWTAEPGPAEFAGYTNFEKDGKKIAGVGPLMSDEQPPAWTTYLCTDDAEKTAALVTEAGGTVIVPPMAVADLGSMSVFIDAAGAAFGTWQPGLHTGAEVIDSEGTFTWTELSTRDQPTAQAFYERVFGWTAKTAEGYTEFQLGGSSVTGCMDMPDTVPAEVPSYWMPYFAASDPEAKAKEAAGSGGTVVVPLMEFGGGRFSVVRDPHGATFGLLDLKR